MKEQYINLDQICSIRISKKLRINGFDYREIKKYKNFWNFMRNIVIPTGEFQYTSFDKNYKPTDSEFLKILKEDNGYIDVNDNQVYYLPFVKVNLSSDANIVIYFNNEMELNKWIHKIKNLNKNIILI